MKTTTPLVLAFFLIPLAAFAGWEQSTSVTLEQARTDPRYAQLLQRCTRMSRGGYMRQNPQSSFTVALPPGWGSLLGNDRRLQEYHYSVSDRGVAGGKKEGWVVLSDQEPERLTAWIANAVIETSRDQKTYAEARAIALAKSIEGQSGAQFPVVGLVWEDMEGTGHPVAYGFLDGVTVKGAPASFYHNGHRTTAKLGPDVLKEGLSVRWEGNAQAGLYGRIASTTRDQVAALYQKMQKTSPDLNGNAFPAYVRKTWQKAMDSTRNELLVASARDIR